MYRWEREFLSCSELRELEEKVLASEYLGKSPLGKEFVNTKGFSIVFRREALPKVYDEFRYFAPFLSKAVFPKSNAFYLNPLVLEECSRVDAHVDCRLLAAQNVRVFPTIVSILYVRVQDNMCGGELVLNYGQDDAISLNPRTNDLVHFQGNLVHAVSEIVDRGKRISLVCEQYNLHDEVLSGFPLLKVLTEDSIAPRVPGSEDEAEPKACV